MIGSNRDTMTDIFLSYAREDDIRIKGLVLALEQEGLTVFWDRRIPSGETWRSYIGKALDDARCVIVAWSHYSVNSTWVIEEADDGMRRGKLIPVLLDAVEQPRGFREIQAADLTGWKPDMPSPHFDQLIQDVRRHLRNNASDNFQPVPGPTSVSRDDPQGAFPIDIPTHTSDNRILDRPVNLGFDGPIVNEMPNGWFNSEGHVSGVSTRYNVRLVHRDDGVPGWCVLMSRYEANHGEFGSLMQRVHAPFLAGRTIKYEGELRAEEVDGWAGLWLRADGDGVDNLLLDNMRNRSIRGTVPWTRFELSVSLPRETVWVNYGILLSGSGRLYADNLRILVWSAAGGWSEV